MVAEPDLLRFDRLSGVEEAIHERGYMEVTTLTKRSLTEDNYEHTVLIFRDRQAGVSEVYDPDTARFSYNAYCLEKKLLKELFTCEYDFLTDALEVINEEFGTWKAESFDQKGCGNCAAKK